MNTLKLVEFPSRIPIILVMALSLTFCKNAVKNEPGAPDSKKEAKELNKAKANEEKESKFMIDAAELSLLQIELGKMAMENGGTKEIKEMGKKFKAEHEKLFEELKKLADEKKISIPQELTASGLDSQSDLNQAKDDDFGKRYCEILVENHKEAIKKYKSATEDIEDIEIKNWATKVLPVLRDHMDQVMTCEQKFINDKGEDDKREKRRM